MLEGVLADYKCWSESVLFIEQLRVCLSGRSHCSLMYKRTRRNHGWLQPVSIQTGASFIIRIAVYTSLKTGAKVYLVFVCTGNFGYNYRVRQSIEYLFGIWTYCLLWSSQHIKVVIRHIPLHLHEDACHPSWFMDGTRININIRSLDPFLPACHSFLVSSTPLAISCLLLAKSFRHRILSLLIWTSFLNRMRYSTAVAVVSCTFYLKPFSARISLCIYGNALSIASPKQRYIISLRNTKEHNLFIGISDKQMKPLYWTIKADVVFNKRRGLTADGSTEGRKKGFNLFLNKEDSNLYAAK